MSSVKSCVSPDEVDDMTSGNAAMAAKIVRRPNIQHPLGCIALHQHAPPVAAVNENSLSSEHHQKMQILLDEGHLMNILRAS
ncbi:hypothetical protein L1787_15725 [Acuticoccus sp. M5D2P5]|uniref:hypothetical protein n=1 Tax=Acuticoccus kalidii TaxID=2910977 RepID=UPI001F356390|nr:hypothetical protein [Acuticoccus kalidii]MCF3934852.1 hypothetical protein [Acuticoccus kalidii]